LEQVWGPIEQIFRNQVVRGSSGEVKTQYEDLLAFVAENYRINMEKAPSGSGIHGMQTDLRGVNQWAIGFLNDAMTNPNFQWDNIAGASKIWESAAGIGMEGVVNQTAEAAGMPTANDMYVPTNGRPIALNSADQVLAMMGGGAVDQAMKRGGGGSGAPVTINVQGGNIREVQQAVIRGIRIAQGEPFA
jgi:hypothetical protein